MTDIHDVLKKLTPEPDMDFLAHLDQQIQSKIEQETTNPMITTHDNNISLFDTKRILLLAGLFLMVLFSGLLLFTYSPAPDNDLSTSLLQTTPTVAPQVSCQVEPESGWLVHIVVEDDTVEAISQQFAIEAQDFLDANCVSEIRAGELLFIPADVQYASFVSDRFIQKGTAIAEDSLAVAYYPTPLSNNLPANASLNGAIALRTFRPGDIVTRFDVGFQMIELEDQTLTAQPDHVLVYVRYVGEEYEPGTEVYYQGNIIEGCILMDRQGTRDHILQCADGTIFVPHIVPTAKATVLYNEGETVILEVSIDNAVQLNLFRFATIEIIGTTNLESDAGRTMVVSISDLPESAADIEMGTNLTWRVTIDKCNEALEEFLSCDGIAIVYDIKALAINVIQPANNPDAEMFVTITLSPNDADVLQWALENDVEIQPIE